MWDPDYRSYIMDYLEEQEIEPPSSDPSDFEEDTDEEEEEEEEIEEGNENADDVTVEIERECSSQRMGIDDGKGGVTASLKGGDDVEENGELNRGEIDGLFCPICFEAWSSGGDHHVCCLPCGHIYGLSCIKKWLRRRGSSKCPQCKTKCGVKDIRLLYATRVVAIDGELQKTVRSLKAKCGSLEKKSEDLSKKEVEWKMREANLLRQVRCLEELMQEIFITHKQVDARVAAAIQPVEGSTEPQLVANSQFHMNDIGREKKRRLCDLDCKSTAISTNSAGSGPSVTSSYDLDALRRQLKEEMVQEIRAEVQAAMHKVRAEMQAVVRSEIRAAVQPHMASMETRMASMESMEDRMNEMIQKFRDGMFPSVAPSIQHTVDTHPANGVADSTNENADLGDG